MANYIGNVPASGEFKRLDSIASSFDGSTTQFNLSYNTVSQTAGDASQLIVSLNGIVQEPLESYTLGIGGSSIIFSTAPASGDTCHIVLLGGVGSTITPTDGSVTATKLDASLKDYYEDEYTADGSTTDFTLSRESTGVNMLLVTIDGIVQPTSAYTASGTTLTISPALPNGTNIRVVHMGVKAGVYVPQSGSVGLNEVDLVAFDGRYYQEDDTAIFSTVRSAGTAQFDNSINLKASTTNYIYFDDALQLAKNGTGARLHIDANGNVGIGTATPASALHVSGGVIIENGGSGSNSLDLTYNGVSGQANIQADSSGGSTYLTFGTSSSGVVAERVRIDSDGGFMVGTTTHRTAEFSHPDGFSIRNDVKGQFQSTVTDSLCGLLNRDGSNGNGDILGFRHDGVDIGRIGYASGSYFKVNASTDYMTVGTPAIGLRFANDYNTIHGYHPSNDANKNDIDLGYNGIPFGNLYLSGGIRFDSRSSKLDDYEEGTFDPSLNNSNYSGSTGYYIKIGSVVHVWLGLQISGSGSLQVNNLPFYVTNSSWSGHVAIQNTGSDNIYPFVHNESYNLWIRNNSNNDYNASSFAGKFIYVQATYFTNQ